MFHFNEIQFSQNISVLCRKKTHDPLKMLGDLLDIYTKYKLATEYEDYSSSAMHLSRNCKTLSHRILIGFNSLDELKSKRNPYYFSNQNMLKILRKYEMDHSVLDIII
jgi:hypothetical protein